MNGASVNVGWGLAAALLVLVAVAVAVSLVARFGIARMLSVASLRAVVQLALVATVIVAVVRSWWLTVAFVLVMLGVASWTSARRMTPHRSGLFATAAITSGVLPVLAIALLSGAVPLTGIAVVPVAGIVIGGAMTATSLGGRRALDDLEQRRDEYEAALALGGRHRDAAMLVCRPAATQALVPPMDQTRTVGLVTLPGAFVGVLIGSGNPVQAAAAQVLVLIGLLAAETVAVAGILELVARGRVVRPPADSHRKYTERT
ncbi:ABC transporter permease [Actinomycetospora endophytica]|uniref:ABC transporter permease n=1 Tax=Actinomycetospora endophytica TaxID=2291215 RepID=A0ABS8PBW7_9PSEU|nr:ABC transporter permease [Actinomycetospora endophytica]MCD2195786.1 ABC transporter permease [Actinomycetospora endophytica]